MFMFNVWGPSSRRYAQALTAVGTFGPHGNPSRAVTPLSHHRVPAQDDTGEQSRGSQPEPVTWGLHLGRTGASPGNAGVRAPGSPVWPGPLQFYKVSPVHR